MHSWGRRVVWSGRGVTFYTGKVGKKFLNFSFVRRACVDVYRGNGTRPLRWWLSGWLYDRQVHGHHFESGVQNNAASIAIASRKVYVFVIVPLGVLHFSEIWMLVDLESWATVPHSQWCWRPGCCSNYAWFCFVAQCALMRLVIRNDRRNNSLRSTGASAWLSIGTTKNTKKHKS